jgi:hypothetical protein
MFLSALLIVKIYVKCVGKGKVTNGPEFAFHGFGVTGVILQETDAAQSA